MKNLQATQNDKIKALSFYFQQNNSWFVTLLCLAKKVQLLLCTMKLWQRGQNRSSD